MKLRQASSVQLEALQWSQGKDSVAFFMQMRLGKTMTSIRWAAQKHSVLVICPLSVISEWQNELAKEGIDSLNLHSIKKELRFDLLDLHSDDCWFLANPATIRLEPELLTAGTINTVILDESVVIKSPKTALFKAMISVANLIPRKALLSGLPAPENCMELCCQFLWLMGRFMSFDNYYKARAALTFAIPTTSIRKTKKQSWDRVKQWLHANAFCRTQKEAGFKRRHRTTVIKVSSSKQQREDTKTVKQLWELRGIETKHTLTITTWLKRLAGGFSLDSNGEDWIVCNKAKARATLKLVARGKTIIWFNYTAEIDYIATVLDAAGLRVGRITGATKIEDRAVSIGELKVGLINVLLIQVKCGLYGLNLSSAIQAIYYSLPWSCNEFKQSIERIIDRDGKRKTTYVLQCKESIDAKLHKALKGKSFNSTQLISNYFKGDC